MIYPETPETILTNAEAQLLRRLLLLITPEQLESLVGEYEQLLERSDYGTLTLTIKARRLRFIVPAPSLEIEQK